MDSESNQSEPLNWDEQVILNCAERGQQALEVYLSKYLAFSLYWESWSKPESED